MLFLLFKKLMLHIKPNCENMFAVYNEL